MDALDAAAVAIKGRGLSMRARLIAADTEPLGELRDPMRALAAGAAFDASAVARVAQALGELHAAVCRRVAREAGRCDLVCAHGQTIHHAEGVTWQLFDPWPLAAALERPVCFDLRRADVAMGGQGAPITPLADWILFRDETESRAVVNLGGYCNCTLLDAGAEHDAARGRDICACNHVLDAAARRALGEPFDDAGTRAGAGEPDDEATTALIDLLAAQAKAGRSLGTGDETVGWVDDWRERLSPENLLASACSGVARVVAEAVQGVDRVLLAGGGAKNATLARMIGQACPSPIDLTDAHGAPAQVREAMCMAVLGALCADGESITLPQATGRRSGSLLAGAWVNARPTIEEPDA